MINAYPVSGAAAASREPVLAGSRLAVLDRVRIYACGITPYDVTHLGHAATFVWTDALSRTLRFLGAEPEVCRNVTDVDDVLDVAAGRAGAPYDSFAAVQQYYFERDMAALNVRAPRHEPRAHRYVPQVIRLAAGLLGASAAYQRAGSVYFRGTSAAERAGLDRAAALRLSAEYGGRPDDPVLPEYSIAWPTRASACGREAMMVGWPGAAHDRLPAGSTGTRPLCPSGPQGPGQRC